MSQTDKELLEEIGLRIKKARKASKMKQVELAEKISMDRGYVWMIEKWKANITLLKLKKIFEELWMEFKI